MEERWARHYADSAQLAKFLPDQPSDLLDLGAGAGFPGVVLRILTLDRTDMRCTFCDSVQKKAAFLSRVVAEAGLPACRVVADRAERALLGQGFDVITARAVTALPKLLHLTRPLLKPDGLLIAPKGRRAQMELDEAAEEWSFRVEQYPSETDPEASVLLLRELKAKP
jgi:16S rRNA (guanine527-N7)-methyltransferase